MISEEFILFKFHPLVVLSLDALINILLFNNIKELIISLCPLKTEYSLNVKSLNILMEKSSKAPIIPFLYWINDVAIPNGSNNK